MAAAKKHIKIVKKRTSTCCSSFSQAAPPPLRSKSSFKTNFISKSYASSTSNSADNSFCRHEALQSSPERHLQMCRRKLAEAQGYRQPSPTTFQGSSCYAFGMCIQNCTITALIEEELVGTKIACFSGRRNYSRQTKQLQIEADRRTMI